MVLEKKFGPHFLSHKYESFKFFASCIQNSNRNFQFRIVFVKIHSLSKTREASNSAQDITCSSAIYFTFYNIFFGIFCETGYVFENIMKWCILQQQTLLVFFSNWFCLRQFHFDDLVEYFHFHLKNLNAPEHIFFSVNSKYFQIHFLKTPEHFLCP